MRSHSVTCRPAEVTFQPLPPAEAGLDLATPKGCKAELALLSGYVSWWYTRLKTVTHPSTNRARRMVTSFMRRTTITTTPRRSCRSLNGKSDKQISSGEQVGQADEYKVMIAAEAGGSGIAKVIDRAWRHWMMHEVAINRSVAPTRARPPPGIKHLPARNYRRRWSDIARSE